MMSDTEFSLAQERLQATTARLRGHEARLIERGLTPAEIKRALDPLRSLTLQLHEEVEAHERVECEG
jgi:hypothetical protein